ncbi:hypothetical protein TRFO_13466 [Tritrichomonas foetus]|uniref:Uncharacterized protein n=1 Tax=Tritrichomonas foetus TaxID=1144522 RepID=A0A1J4KZ46_9EUKA|nr:hypothetical protein TRFO_13466 [Tritrichomonas foetus]|eukprot:OHT16136.1 hypothetical protein TRFO_13466 [Tritrichomonas foetus]
MKRNTTGSISQQQAPSVISQQLEAISHPFGVLANEVFNKFPTKPAPGKKEKDEEKNKIAYEGIIYEYLDRPIVSEGEIRKVIQNAAFVAAAQPESSFAELVGILPSIKIDSKEKPEPAKKVTVLTYLTTIDWENTYHRATFQYLVDSIISYFLNRLLLVAEDLGGDQAKVIFKQVIDIWYPNSPHPAFYERLRLINWKYWSHIIYVLSCKCPQDVASQLIKRMPAQKDSDIAIQVYLNLFQSVYIGNESELNYNSLPEKFKDLESIAKRSSTNGPIHAPAMIFFTNLMGYLLVAYPPYRELQFIFDLSEIAKNYTTEKNYIGPAYSLRALLYRFTKHKKMKLNLEEYSKKYIEKRYIEQLAPYHLESFISFIRGHSYAAKCQLEVSQENYRWRFPSKETDTMKYMFKYVISNPGMYKEAQPQLADFLTQYASNDFTNFVSNDLPSVIKPDFASQNQHALFLMTHHVLSPKSRFREFSNGGNDESSLNRFKHTINNLVQDLLTQSVNKIKGGDVSVFGVQSFVDTLNLHKIAGSENDDSTSQTKLENCLHSLCDTSAALHLDIPRPKMIMSSEKRKWTKYMVKTFEDLIFETISNHSALKIAKNEIYEVDKLIMSLSILPFLIYDESTIRKLVSLIFSPNQHVGSISLRVLQAFIHIDSKWLNTIITSIATASPPTQEYLYLQLQALNCIIQSALFIHADIYDETLQLVFQTILLSLCSNEYTIRAFALDISSNLSKLCGKKEPDFTTFMENNQITIEQQVQKLAISIGSFNIENDLSDCGTISFDTIARSAVDCLYFFALQAIANTFVHSSIKSSIEKAKTYLCNAIAGIGRTHKIFRVNLYIMLAGVADASLKDFLKQNNESIQQTLQSMEKSKLLAYCAYYTAIHPSIGTDIVSGIISSDPFSMNVVSFVIRMYINDEPSTIDFVKRAAIFLLETYKRLKIAEPTIIFKANNAALADDNILYSMNNFLIALHSVYAKKFSENATNPQGPYARKKRILFEADAKSTEAQDVMFTFLMNMSCLTDDPRLDDCRRLSRETLDTYIKTYRIPNDLFNLMCKHLVHIGTFSFTSVELILSNYFLDIIPLYLEKAPTEHLFFKAIASQYEDIQMAATFLKNWSGNALQKMSNAEQQFSMTTFSNTGRLIALAFLKLASIDTNERKDGFRVLFNVILGSILIHDPHAHIGPLIQKLIRLRALVAAQHPQLSENLLTQISILSRKELAFCSEQFIITAFELLKVHRDNMVFLSCIVPWIDGLILNRSENGIVVGCEKEFTCLSTFKFFQMFIECVITVPLNRAHVQMIDQILQQPSEEKTSTLDFFIMSMYRLQQISESNAEKCIAVLAYCLAKKQKKVINLISQYLTFKSWFYHQIQLSRIDLAFDMDKFMDTIKSAEESEASNTNSKSRSTIDADDDDMTINLYETVVKFSIRVFLAFLSENKNSVSRVVHILLLFCLVNYESFDRTTDLLLKQICGEQKSDVPMLLHSFSSALITEQNGNVSTNAQNLADDINHLAKLTNATIPVVAVSVQYIYSMSAETQKLFCREAFKWAIGCGELQLASRAAKLYLMFMNEADEEIITAIIRAIYTTTQIVSERSDPSYRSSQNFISAIVEQKAPNYQLAIDYLTLLFQILDKSQKFLYEPSVSSLYVAVSCLQFRESIQMALVSAAIQLILNSLENEQFAESIVKSDFCTNLLRPLLEMAHTVQSLGMAFKLMNFLTIKYPSVLVDQRDSPLLILSVIPYAYMNQHDPQVKQLMKSLSEFTVDSQLATEIQKPLSGSADDFCKPLMARILRIPIQEEDYSRVIKFYSSISSCNKNMFAPVVSICTTIISSPSFKHSIDLFAEIGFIAIHDNDTSRNAIVLDFLSNLNNRGGIVKAPQISKLMKKKLPEIKLRTPIDVTSWAPTEDADPFAHVRDYPPLSIIDLDYIGCSFQKPISVAVQQVKVEPFSTWTAAMFRAEAFTVQCDNQMIETITVSDEGQQIFDTFERALKGEFEDDPDNLATDGSGIKSALKSKKSKAKLILLDSPNSSPAEKVQTNVVTVSTVSAPEPAGIQIAFLSTSEFTPSNEEIDKLGAELLEGIDVPSFFPTELK